MNEYKDYSSINRMLDHDICIFKSIKENPFSILLFKNIDKGNKRIIRIIMNSIDKGYIEDINNEKIYISKCIIFFSVSNINKSIGFDDKEISNDLVNCFDKVIYLNKDSIKN